VLIAKLAISTVFDSRSAEFLERWPRAIGASACRAGVEARPAMEGALQVIAMVVRTAMHSESVMAAGVSCAGLYFSEPHPPFFKSIQI
jgi:hypothetical protein